MKNEQKRNEAIYLLEQQCSQEEIMQKTGLSKSTIYRLQKKMTNEKNQDSSQGSHKNIKEVGFISENIEDIERQSSKELDALQHFADSILYAQVLIDEMPELYKKIGDSNIEMQKILHHIEECESDEELFESAKNLYLLRKKRRMYKNKYYMGSQLKYLFSANKTHTNALVNISKGLNQVVYNIKNYIPYSQESSETENRVNNGDDNMVKDVEVSMSQDKEKEEEVWDEWKDSLRQALQS